MSLDAIKNEMQSLESYIQTHPDDHSVIGTKIEKIRKEIETFQTSIPALKTEKERKRSFTEAAKMQNHLVEITKRVSSSHLVEPKDESAPESAVSIQAARGISLTAHHDTKNPVAFVPKEHFLSLFYFQTRLKGLNLKEIEKLSKKTDPRTTLPLTVELAASDANDYELSKFFQEIKDKYPDLLFDKQYLKSSAIDLAEEKIQTSPHLTESVNASLNNLLKIVDDVVLPQQQAQLLLDLLKDPIPAEAEKRFVRYDYNEIRHNLLTQFDQQIMEYNLQHIEDPIDINDAANLINKLLFAKTDVYGKFLSREEAKDLVKYLNQGLKTTFPSIKLNVVINAKPYVDAASIKRVCDAPDINAAQFLEKMGVQPALTSAVIKGGIESFREPMMIHLAQKFNLEEAVLKKEVMVNPNFTTSGVPLPVASPFISDLQTSQYATTRSKIDNEKRYDFKINDVRAYDQAFQEMYSVTTAEGYGEALALSLLLHAADDHMHQFALINGRLVNYDMGRDLPATRSTITDNGKQLYIHLRSGLINFPQFNDPLHPNVVEKLRKITPELIEESLAEARISEFQDPNEMVKILKQMMQNPPATPQEEQDLLKLIGTMGNRQAVKKIENHFTDQAVLSELLAKAEEGCELPRSLAIHDMQMKQGVDKKKIENEIKILKRASVDEREIERMKEGQRRVIAKIEANGGKLTGRELAETLYPEEMVIIDAYGELGYFLPSVICAGITSFDVNYLADVLVPATFDANRVKLVKEAQAKLRDEAGTMAEFSQYCLS